MKKFIFVLYFILSLMFLLTALLMIPGFTNLGNFILHFSIALIILIYIFLYLVKILTKTSGITQILVIIEMVLSFVIVSLLIISEFVSFIAFDESFKMLLIVLWLHSFFSILRNYTTKNSETKSYHIWIVIIDMLLITLSSIALFILSVPNDLIIYMMIVIQTIISIGLMIISIVTLCKKEKLND